MRIAVYPIPLTFHTPYVGYEFRITEEMADGKREKAFWLKAWRLRRNMQFFVDQMVKCACGVGILAIPFPRDISSEKMKALIKASDDLKLWERERSYG